MHTGAETHGAVQVFGCAVVSALLRRLRPITHVEQKLHIRQHHLFLQRCQDFINILLEASILAHVFRVNDVIDDSKVDEGRRIDLLFGSCRKR